MNYTSTRDNSISVSSAQAITMGLSKNGGLFIPTEIPEVTMDEIKDMIGMSYIERAKKVLSLYLTDFTEDELNYCVNGAYNGTFASKSVAPVVNIDETMNILELWHGPTCAFKDMALQLLPYLLTVSAKKTSDGKTIVILVATSGDTGKAALEGFKDVENTKIIVFYPDDGVSPMQKFQMITQEGQNVNVSAIKGNFDDAQNGVKKIFGDAAMAEKLAEANMMFSSANSINWGRLVPQIVYYFSAYCDLIKQGRIELGEKVNFVVPTGNFGNILAAYYAKLMGLPVNKLICASNKNKVLTDFITNGIYNRNREFFTTNSPSMDILISSNLERLLYHLQGNDSDKTSALMKSLSETGTYTVDADTLAKIKELFECGFCDDEGTNATIKNVFNSNKYLCDTHTAVAISVYENYRKATGDKTPTVIDSTASPYKFCASVLDAVKGDCGDADEFTMVDELSAYTGAAIPSPIANLKGKTPRFDKNICGKDEMAGTVLSMLGIK
ncbi:MAG: threonine synthase [Clostridia bacterium]|nr:threonine synthase [Clostridia bacterium]